MPKGLSKLLIAVVSVALFATAATTAPASAAPVNGLLPQNTPAASVTHKSSSSKKKKSSHRHSSRREPFQKAPIASRISEIQTALSRGGYFEGEPNGKWDANTVSAMQKFQSANGLNSSGKIDATTLQKLGLGSSTAGVDAPRPVKKSDATSSTNTSIRAATTSNANSASNVTPAPAAATPASSSTKPQH